MALTMRVPTGAPRLVFEDPGNPLTEGLATAASTLWNLGPRLRAIEEAKAERKRQQAMDTERLGMEKEAHAAKMAQMQERPPADTQPKPGKLHKITDPISQTTQWLRETPEGGLVQIQPQMLPQPAHVAVEEAQPEAGPTRSWPQFWQDLGSGWLWDAQQIDPVARTQEPLTLGPDRRSRPPEPLLLEPYQDPRPVWPSAVPMEGLRDAALAGGQYVPPPVPPGIPPRLARVVEALEPDDQQAVAVIMQNGGPEAQRLLQYLATLAGG